MPMARTPLTSGPMHGRDAHVSLVGERVYLDGSGGVVAGAAMEEIFDQVP